MGMNLFANGLPRLVDLSMRGRRALNLLIAERIALKDASEGFAKMMRGHSGRSITVSSSPRPAAMEGRRSAFD